MKLFKVTPSFKILSALLSKDKSFSELKKDTGLSNRWLSKTLKDLLRENFITRNGTLYQLTSPEKVNQTIRIQLNNLNKLATISTANLYRKAVEAANFIAKTENVLAIILFGSVAKRKATEESDIDLLIICLEQSNLTDIIYDAMVKVEAPIEALTLSLKEFLHNLLGEPTILFGILEGYEVLYDKFNIVRGLLTLKGIEIKKRWFYDSEEGIWLERKLMPYLKQHTTN